MHLLRTTIVLVFVVALAVAVAPVAPAGNPTPAELTALDVRGRALNEQCDNPMLSREAFRVLCGNAGAQHQPTRAELKALDVRGRAMGDLCDGGNIVSVKGYRAVCGGSAQLVTLAAPEVSSSSGFDWGDFGIGVAAMLGLTLLFGGIGATVHHGRRGSARPRTVS